MLLDPLPLCDHDGARGRCWRGQKMRHEIARPTSALRRTQLGRVYGYPRAGGLAGCSWSKPVRHRIANAMRLDPILPNVPRAQLRN